MGFRGFVFDCDGTLMDTIGAWHEAETALLEEAGAVMTKEQRDELNSLTLEEAGAFFFERFGVRESPEAVVEAILDHLLEFYRTRSEANPGALEFVRAVHESGAPTCVLSSSPQQFLQVGLARGGFTPFIDHVISVEDINATKREGRTYEHVCRLLGTPLRDTWFFDDSWYALQAARDCGMRTVGVYSADGCGTHEELARYSDLVVDAFSELEPGNFVA